MATDFEWRSLGFDPHLPQAHAIRSFRAEDNRGALVKDYNVAEFAAHGIANPLAEVFYTESKRGVVRALHFQLPHGNHGCQAKTVRCISGRVYDVVCDLRPWSSTYKQWRGLLLSGNSYEQVHVPAWFGHGYIVVEDSIVCYRTDEVFTPGDSGVKWDDPDLAIDWHCSTFGLSESDLVLSNKDKHLMSFDEYDKLVRKEYYADYAPH